MYDKISKQYPKGANEDSVATNKDQDKTSAKQKPMKTTKKYTRPTKKNKIEKIPKEQLVVSQAALASRKKN